MAVAPYRQLLEAANAQGRGTAIPPIAVEVSLVPGYGPHDDKTLFEPSVLLSPVPHPVLEAYLEVAGATRRGALSWVIGLGEDYNPAPLRILTTRLLPGTLMLEHDAATARAPRNLFNIGHPYNRLHNLHRHLQGTAAALPEQNLQQVVNQAYPPDGPGKYGVVTLSGDNRVLWVKVATHQLNVPTDEDDVFGMLPQIPLNLRPAGKSRIDARPVRAVDAIAVLDWLTSEGVTLVDRSEDNALAVLRDRVARSIIATPTPGRPAMADTSIGRNVFRLPDVHLPFGRPAPQVASARTRMSALDVATLSQALPEGTAVIHPGTADTGAMALAQPVEDDRLKVYQREAVGLHATTTVGFLNCVAPGMGKTVMSYAAMERRSTQVDAYRGLVVAEANVRAQWVTEGAIWFPGANVVTIESRTDASRLAEALASTDPVVAVVSYGLLASVTEEVARRAALAELDTDLPDAPAAPAVGALKAVKAPAPEPVACPPARAVVVEALPDGIVPFDVEFGQLDLFSLFAAPAAGQVEQLLSDEPSTDPDAADAADVEGEAPAVPLGALLLDTFWHDIAADEAEVLRGTGSKQAQAMWTLRGNSGVAVALTGTPINKGVDDLGRLLAWVRGDEHLFHGVRLSTQFDLDDDDQLEEFLESMGPLLFRRDSSEIADELPTIVPTIMKLTPSPEETALAGAARAELKRVYLELMAWLDMVEESDPDNPDYAQAREGLKAARGAWLGGTTLARMASSDPAALLGSTSAGAALLAGQGLIEAATAKTGTKRAAVVATVADRVANGKRVLIFTEFATVARGLIDDLDAAGVRVGAVLGGGGRRRDQMIVAFQNGELDVLVCTSSGERGLNLQQANVIVHYDLPWTPKGVIQRTGRAMRIRSENTHLEVIFPLMEGTIEERVAALVVTRAVEAMRALDASRGVDTSQTEMGLALGGLVTAVADAEAARKGGTDLMAMTQALVA